MVHRMAEKPVSDAALNTGANKTGKYAGQLFHYSQIFGGNNECLIKREA